MKILISTSAEKPLYKKGDRIIINTSTKRKPWYYTVTVTQVRAGKWHVLYDDGDKGTIDDIKDIVGYANKKKRKTSFTNKELSTYSAGGDISIDPKVIKAHNSKVLDSKNVDIVGGDRLVVRLLYNGKPEYYLATVTYSWGFKFEVRLDAGNVTTLRNRDVVGYALEGIENTGTIQENKLNKYIKTKIKPSKTLLDKDKKALRFLNILYKMKPFSVSTHQSPTLNSYDTEGDSLEIRFHNKLMLDEVTKVAKFLDKNRSMLTESSKHITPEDMLTGYSNGIWSFSILIGEITRFERVIKKWL